MEDILLFGMGGHAKSVIDSIEEKKEYRIVGILDEKKKVGLQYRNYRVIGEDTEITKYYKEGIKYAFVTIGYMGESIIRRVLYDKLKKVGYNLPIIVDLTASLASDVILGEGSYVGKKCIVNSNAIIGKMCILNTGAIIEHDCVIEDYTHIAVGSVLCGNVHIGHDCLIGANATIIQGKKIGQNTIVGAGTIITKNIEDNYIIYNKVKRMRN